MKKDFFIPLKKIPNVTHQDKNVKVVNGKAIIYKSDNLRNAEDIFKSRLAEYVPEEMFKAPVILKLVWCYPMGKDKIAGQYKVTKPDVDNLAKTFIDCMTKCGFWKDDSAVANLQSVKVYDNMSGIYVCVEDVLEVD